MDGWKIISDPQSSAAIQGGWKVVQPPPTSQSAPSIPDDQWTAKTDAWGDTPDARTPDPNGLFGPDYMRKMVSDPNTKWSQSQYGFKTAPVDVSAINPKIGKTVLREDGALWDNNQRRWVKMNQADLKTSPAPSTITPQSTEQVGDGGFGTSLLDKLKAYGEARNKRYQEHPIQAGLSDIGNLPLGPAGMLGWGAQQARNVLGGTPTTAENLLGNPTIAGTVKGLADIPIGTGQLMAHGGAAIGIPGATDNAAAMDQAAKEAQDYYTQNYDPSQTGEMLGQAAPFLATGGASSAPAVAQKLPWAVNALKVGGQRAMEGGLIGAMQPDPQAAVDNQYGQRAMGRAEIGAGLGVAAPLAGQAAVKTTGTVLDKLAGTKVGNALRIPTELKPEYKGAPELFQEQIARGETPTVGGVTGDPILLAEQKHFQSNSPKMEAFKTQSNVNALTDAESIASSLQKEVNASNWTNLDQVKAAAAGNGKRAAKAQEVLQMIKDSGVDNGKIEQASGSLELLIQKMKADELSGKLESIAAPLGNLPSKPIANELGSIVSSLKSNTASNPETITLLSRIKDGIENGTQDLSMSGARALRSELNSKINSLVGSAAAPSKSEIVPLQKAVSAIDDAIEGFVKTGPPELKTAFTDFNNHYKANVVPYKDTKFGGALTSEDPFKGENIFKGGNENEQARYLSLLGEKGQAAVRARLIQDIVKGGTLPQQGVGKVTADPQKIADGLKKLSDNGTLDVVFKGEDRKVIEGLWRAMQTVSENGSAGYSVKPNVIETVRPTRPWAVHEILGRGWDKLNEDRLLKLYTDPTSRLMLKRASTMKPGSPDILTLLRNFGKTPQDIARTQ